MIKLSIIIPVYNLEHYIRETLLSCLDQDLPPEDYEILCIDDGSTDESAAVIREVQKTHGNVVLIQKENGGVSSARNKGLELARGEYVWFIDGDDLIAPNCLGFLYSSVKTGEADLFWFKLKPFSDSPTFEDFSDKPVFVCRNEAEKYDFMFSKGGGGVCVVLYRNQMLREHHFGFHEDIRYSEDVLFSFEAIIASSVCAKTDAVIYYYRQRPGSAMHSHNTAAHIESMEKLAVAYDGLSVKYGSDQVKKILLNKRDFAVKALLFSIMQQGDPEAAKSKLQELKKAGFYPYPFKKELLIGNETGKQWIINLISFFFPVKWYFLLCVRIFSLKKRKRSQ